MGFEVYNLVFALKRHAFGVKEEMTYKGVKVKALFEPVDDRVFFVGEHTTILEEIGTMEVAVESRERIANVF